MLVLDASRLNARQYRNNHKGNGLGKKASYCTLRILPIISRAQVRRR